LLITGNTQEVVVPLAVSVYFYLLCLTEIHKKERHQKKEASNSEGCVLTRFFSLRHKALNFSLNEEHLALKSLAGFSFIPVLLRNYRIRRPARTTNYKYHYTN